MALDAFRFSVALATLTLVVVGAYHTCWAAKRAVDAWTGRSTHAVQLRKRMRAGQAVLVLAHVVVAATVVFAIMALISWSDEVQRSEMLRQELVRLYGPNWHLK